MESVMSLVFIMATILQNGFSYSNVRGNQLKREFSSNITSSTPLPFLDVERASAKEISTQIKKKFQMILWGHARSPSTMLQIWANRTAFNPEYPFVYRVPLVVNYILDNPHLNKSEVAFNSPYANIPREKLGDYYYHKVSTCGTHFLNPSEGFILSDKMFENSSRADHCVWGFVGSQFCTPSIECPHFDSRIQNTTVDCRTNYLQIADDGENFALHFCDMERRPKEKTEYASPGGVLDVTLRFSTPMERPQFECLVKCVPYEVNFTMLNSLENKTTVQVLPPSTSIESNVPEIQISRKCRCGVSNNPELSQLFEKHVNNSNGNKSARILGGRETIVGQYPWMAALVHKDNTLPFCGASLINDRYVLTAQHCLDDESEDDFEVVLNEHDFLNSSETIGKTIRRGISKFIKFNHYLSSVFDGDMALLALDEPVDISNPTLTPICLPENSSNSYIDYDVIGAGWGTLNETSDKSPKLLEVMLRVMSNAACNDYHSSQPPVPLQVSERMLCSGYPEGGRDTCSGDSGGPLITLENGRFTQIGVTSWGFGCGNELNPGVFARITAFLNWIHMNTLDGVYCS